MKLLKPMVLLPLLCLLIGCTNDEGEEKIVDVAEISGAWNLTMVDSDEGVARFSSGELTAETLLSVSSKDENTTLIIGKDPNTVESNGGFTMIYTLKQGNQVVNTFEQVVENLYYDAGSWEFSETSGIVFIPAEDSLGLELAFEIVELTDKSLILKQLINEPLLISGYEVEAEASVFYHFAK